MDVIRAILYMVVYVFFVLLLIRLVVDWIQVFTRELKPKGIFLILLEAVYTVTDPPVKALRRLIPPLRIGSVALDLSFLLLLLAVSFLLRLLA